MSVTYIPEGIYVSGTPNADTLQGGSGNDTIDGGAGLNRAIFAGNRANIIHLEMCGRDELFGTYEVDLEVNDLAHLTRIVSALRASDAVAEAERI